MLGYCNFFTCQGVGIRKIQWMPSLEMITTVAWILENFSCLKKRNFCKNRICENQGLEGKNEGLEDDVFFLKVIFQVPW